MLAYLIKTSERTTKLGLTYKCRTNLFQDMKSATGKTHALVSEITDFQPADFNLIDPKGDADIDGSVDFG